MNIISLNEYRDSKKDKELLLKKINILNEVNKVKLDYYHVLKKLDEIDREIRYFNDLKTANKLPFQSRGK